MEKLDWNSGDRFGVRLDERGPEFGQWTFTLGAPVTGLMVGERGKVPEGTLLYGRAYKTEALPGEPLGDLRIIYDHVEIPGKGKQPVCVVSGPNAIRELKDDKATAQANASARAVTSWEPPRD
jgi:hypothetical protein